MNVAEIWMKFTVGSNRMEDQEIFTHTKNS